MCVCEYIIKHTISEHVRDLKLDVLFRFAHSHRKSGAAHCGEVNKQLNKQTAWHLLLKLFKLLQFEFSFSLF